MGSAGLALVWQRKIASGDSEGRGNEWKQLYGEREDIIWKDQQRIADYDQRANGWRFAERKNWEWRLHAFVNEFKWEH